MVPPQSGKRRSAAAVLLHHTVSESLQAEVDWCRLCWKQSRLVRLHLLDHLVHLVVEVERVEDVEVQVPSLC